MVSPTYPTLERSDGSYALGVCDNYDKIIYINDTLSQEKTQKVLCHELVHACIFSYDISLDVHQEEILADLIATYGQEIIFKTNKIFSRIKQNWGTY